MAQNPPLLCPQCNAPAQPHQRFCAECGTTLHVGANTPTALASESQFVQAPPPGQHAGPQEATERAPQPGFAPPAAPGSSPPTPGPGMAPGQMPYASGSSYSTVPTPGNQFSAQTTDANVIPPPPPGSFVAARQESAPPAPGPPVVPDYARAPTRSRGVLMIALVLLLVLALGGVGVYALTQRGKQTGTTGIQTPPASSTSTPGGQGSGAANETLNLLCTYASLALTITSVQYGQSYSSGPAGGVRVSFTETAGPKAGGFLYSDVARLSFPDQSVVAPTNQQ